MSVNSKMTAIADAIRNLLEISGTMGLDAMASNISSITKRGAVAGTISTKSEQYIIPAGYHNGNGTVGIDVAEQAKITAENIKNGVTILGVSGTASGDIYAIIAVTYPAGSTCTCSDGTTTLKARDTSGKALFNVPVGTWTVTARTEDGSKEKSIDVTITAAGQVESVNILFDTYIIRNGVLQPGYEWVKYYNSTDAYQGSISYEDGYCLVSEPKWPNGSACTSFTLKDKIDLSAYKNFILNGYCEYETSWTYIAVDSSTGAYAQQPSASRTGKTLLTKTNSLHIVDLSAINDACYVGFAIGGGGLNIGNNLYIYDLYLE